MTKLVGWVSLWLGPLCVAAVLPSSDLSDWCCLPELFEWVSYSAEPEALSSEEWVVDEISKLPTFSEMQRVLLLADDFDESSQEVVQYLLRVHPGIEVVRGGLRPPVEWYKGQRQIPLDNLRLTLDLEKAGISKGSFDFILMRCGLCYCDPSDLARTCGGLDLESEKSLAFFQGVLEYLNPDNPSAMAVLHGSSWAGALSLKNQAKMKRVDRLLDQIHLKLRDFDPNVSFEKVYRDRTPVEFAVRAYEPQLLVTPEGETMVTSQGGRFQIVVESVPVLAGIRLGRGLKRNNVQGGGLE